MHKNYVKPIFTDLWDEYQMKVATFGGNKKFWDYMKEYGQEKLPIRQKYTSGYACYYKRRLSAQVCEIPFHEPQPDKDDVEDMLDKGVEKVKELGAEAEKGIVKVGNYLDKKFAKFFNDI